MKEQPNIMYTS